MASEKMKGWRLWVFRLAALLMVPALLLLAAEGVLRMAGYGYPAGAVLTTERDDQELYCDNYRFAWRFFPKKIAREFDPFTFPCDKAPGTFRIFVLGASAAQGTPDGSFAFGRYLEVLLGLRYPDTRFEVVTAAMPAINSYAVLEIGKDCLECEPDLFIVYLGNNEVVGPFGAGTIFDSLSTDLSSIRRTLALKSYRLGQLLTGLFKGESEDVEIPPVWKGMKMFLDKQVRADDPNLETVYAHFQKNLEDLRDRALERGCAVALCTVGCNLKDMPPFASLHRPELKGPDLNVWAILIQEGMQYEASSTYEEAARSYQAASELDPEFAETRFRLGRCLYALGETDRAREAFIAARDLDTLRFRADTRINEIIRAVAREGAGRGVLLLDAEKLLEGYSEMGIPGDDLFYEHVHLNPRGSYLVAKGLAETLDPLLPEEIRSKGEGDFSSITEEACDRSLGLTPWDRWRLAGDVLHQYLEKPPFLNQAYHEMRIRAKDEALKAMRKTLTPETLRQCTNDYSHAIRRRPDDWWLYWRYALLQISELKNGRAAVKSYRRVVELLPHSYKGYVGLAMAQERVGNHEGALENGKTALGIKYDNATAHFNLAVAYEDMEEFGDALFHFEESIRIKPNTVAAYQHISAIQVRDDDMEEGVETLQKGIEANEGNADLHYSLGMLLSRMGKRNEALRELDAAKELDPGNPAIEEAIETVRAQ